jgi:hypothetical protein
LSSRCTPPVKIGPQADAQLHDLDAAIGATVEKKILWLAENAGLKRRNCGTGEAVFSREGVARL